MRYAGVLSALLLTAALLCAVPGLMQTPQPQSRADESLRPAELRTLTVWLIPGDVGDRKLLNELCADFEKERRGARIFLRVVTADELEGETAVLPDVALFTTGDVLIPEKAFLPLADDIDPSARFAGVQRAVPLWLAPNVLSIPQSWLQKESSAVPKRDSLLAASTAAPQENADALLAENELPWGMLLRKRAVEAPQGVGYQQLLACCPAEYRAKLVSAVLGMGEDTPSPSPQPEDWVTTVPFSRTASPTPMPQITTPARVETLAQHYARLQKGEAVSAFVFPVAMSDRVRYAALCRDSEDARALMRFFTAHQGDALSHGLIPPGYEPPASDALLQALAEAYQTCTLPNAFVHTKEEIHQICADDFARCEDPVRTLLGLR